MPEPNDSQLPTNFTRDELHALGSKALAQIHPDMNHSWARAFQRLADAADILDAFMGRSSVCPSCGPVTRAADCKPDEALESAQSPEPSFRDLRSVTY